MREACRRRTPCSAQSRWSMKGSVLYSFRFVCIRGCRRCIRHQSREHMFVQPSCEHLGISCMTCRRSGTPCSCGTLSPRTCRHCGSECSRTAGGTCRPPLRRRVDRSMLHMLCNGWIRSECRGRDKQTSLSWAPLFALESARDVRFQIGAVRDEIVSKVSSTFVK